MKPIWLLAGLTLSTLCYAQTGASQTRQPTQAGGLKWFSTVQTQDAPAVSQIEEIKALIRARIEASAEDPSKSDLLKDMALPGQPQEQRKAVLELLESSAGHSEFWFDHMTKWAREQGIRHPQENQFKQLTQKLTNQSFDTKLALLKSFPAQMQKEVLKGAIEYSVQSFEMNGVHKLFEQKNQFSPEQYRRLIAPLLSQLHGMISSDRDFSTAEKMINDFQQMQGANLNKISCELWYSLRDMEEAPDREDVDPEVNTSAEARRYRVMIMKPLLRMQKNKVACSEIPSVLEMAQSMEKFGALTRTDLYEIRSAANKNLSVGANTSTDSINAQNCGLRGVQSDMNNHLMDLEQNVEKSARYFVASTTQGCRIQMINQKVNLGIKTQVTLWNSLGQKITEFSQVFKNRQELVLKMVSGVLPAPPASKVKVLTNLPPVQ